MDLQKLKTEIEGTQYSGKTPDEILSMLNDANIDVVQERRINELGLINAFTDPREGDAVLVALETAATSDSLLARAIDWLKNENGLDVGNGSTRSMIDELTTASVLTSSQATTIKSMAESKISRASELGLGTVKLRHINEALEEINA